MTAGPGGERLEELRTAVRAYRHALIFHESLSVAHAALDAALVAVCQDAARMDWLESKRILHIHGDRPGDFEFSPRGQSLRAAIDDQLAAL